MKLLRLVATPLLVGVWFSSVAALEQGGIDPEALIERIVAADLTQRELIRDITYDAEYVEREDKGDEGVVEKVRLVKKAYVKCLPDTAWFATEYLEYYKEGERKSDNDLKKEAADREEKKAKRKALDVSYPMLRPFYPEHRARYTIEYKGIAEERIDDRVCHQFRVESNEEAENLINGDFYFEADNFRLVRVDFSPAKLTKKLMFRMKELNMSMLYGPTDDGFWLPRQFDIQGKGKAAFFFGVNFAGTEYYRNPVINDGLDDSLFEVNDDN